MGRARDIAKFLSSTEAENTNNFALLHTGSRVGVDSAEVQSIGLSTYDTLDLLPITNLVAGQQAFVKDVRRLYVSNGSGWFNTAVANATPRWDSGGEPENTYVIEDSQTPLTIIARAVDSDNSNSNLLNQSFVSDSAQYMVTISNDSSVFTFTPKSADSIGIEVANGNLTDSNGDFIYTFKWSDGINFVSKPVTITYNAAGTPIYYMSPSLWTDFDNVSDTTQTNGTFGFTSPDTWTLTNQTALFSQIVTPKMPLAYMNKPIWIYAKFGNLGNAFNTRSALGVLTYSDTAGSTLTGYDSYFAIRSDNGSVNNENLGSNDGLASVGAGTVYYMLFYYNGNNSAEVWFYNSASAPTTSTNWTKIQSFDMSSVGSSIETMRLLVSSREGGGGDYVQLLDAATAPLPTPAV